MKHTIATIIALAGVLSLLGLATKALADGYSKNTMSSSTINTNCKTWGCIKCLYGDHPELCLPPPPPTQLPDNKNGE